MAFFLSLYCSRFVILRRFNMRWLLCFFFQSLLRKKKTINVNTDRHQANAQNYKSWELQIYTVLNETWHLYISDSIAALLFACSVLITCNSCNIKLLLLCMLFYIVMFSIKLLLLLKNFTINTWNILQRNDSMDQIQFKKSHLHVRLIR